MTSEDIANLVPGDIVIFSGNRFAWQVGVIDRPRTDGSFKTTVVPVGTVDNDGVVTPYACAFAPTDIFNGWIHKRLEHITQAAQSLKTVMRNHMLTKHKKWRKQRDELSRLIITNDNYLDQWFDTRLGAPVRTESERSINIGEL